MKSAVDAAHAKNHPVAIHSSGPSGVKDAVRAGADSVEHGIELDDETIAEMVRRGTVWVPTIDHNRYYVDAKDEFGFAPDTIPPLQAHRGESRGDRARGAGVKIGKFDVVATMFGRTRELGCGKAGMTPSKPSVRRRRSPRRSRQSTTLGNVAPGFFADLIAVDGDPLQSIDAVHNAADEGREDRGQK
jgi:imidazolonepropionase-like amidohydrolase